MKVVSSNDFIKNYIKVTDNKNRRAQKIIDLIESRVSMHGISDPEIEHNFIRLRMLFKMR